MSTLGPQAKSWQEMREWQIGLLRRSTGRSLEDWNAQVRDEGPGDEAGLRAWLAERGVTGYSQMLLVHERFGYPDFFTKSSDELVDAQYADRRHLRPVFDAVIAVLPEVGETEIQVRKTYVSLVTPRRTFAVVAPSTRTRVDLGLRWDDAPESPRISRAGSRLGGQVTVKIGLEGPGDLDDEVLGWMRTAHAANS
ncbi:hypothetical protein IDM40_13180 [Nocardiopsis sp. HNM0947]|uniref:DUF5655 domain-containing protein n=1 Tax=Nocardiopsis coralli TaxID=2772213 RepID=A0ABR9P730_9ACTN|nr:DUF5655 domain-containing protein [Nocardiopsis coralli]MBE2999654.1 hypothetical protein [Nocardiopsis coralli]